MMTVLYWCVFAVGAGLETEKQSKAQNNQVKGLFLVWVVGMAEENIKTFLLGVREGRG